MAVGIDYYLRPDEIEDFKACWAEGLIKHKIAMRFKMSEAQVDRCRDLLALPKRTSDGGESEYVWPPEKRALLAALWTPVDAAGEPLHSASAIARRLGCSKNAVIGKARRMGLPGRKSPIRPESETSRRRRRQSRAQRLKAAIEILTRDTARAKLESGMGVASGPAAGSTLEPAIGFVPMNGGCFQGAEPPKPKGCQWPEGDLRDGGLSFCGAPVKPGKPYCAAHCAVAYYDPKPAKGAAAADETEAKEARA